MSINTYWTIPPNISSTAISQWTHRTSMLPTVYKITILRKIWDRNIAIHSTGKFLISLPACQLSQEKLIQWILFRQASSREQSHCSFARDRNIIKIQLLNKTIQFNFNFWHSCLSQYCLTYSRQTFLLNSLMPKKRKTE